MRRDLETEQVAVSSPDLTAAVLRLQDRQVLVVSVYVQCNDVSALLAAVREVSDLISRFRKGTGHRTEVVVAGDFNRHDVLWGGEGTIMRRQGEGQPIVDLMNDHGLQSLLPRGTKTWQGPKPGLESTIDLVMATEELAEEGQVRHTSDRIWIRPPANPNSIWHRYALPRCRTAAPI